MKANLFILNLSSKETGGKLRTVDGLKFGGTTAESSDCNAIPTDGPLVLYVLGHGIPDALVVEPDQLGVPAVARGNLLPDTLFAAFLKGRRGENKTVIIWDICFARSFEDVDGGWAGYPYVHIFCSEAHEQAWHSGPGGDTPRESLFSRALREALNEGDFGDWSELTRRLQEQLGEIQTASIPNPRLPPQEFDSPPPRGSEATSSQAVKGASSPQPTETRLRLKRLVLALWGKFFPGRADRIARRSTSFQS